jgi:hypothetical protein
VFRTWKTQKKKITDDFNGFFFFWVLFSLFPFFSKKKKKKDWEKHIQEDMTCSTRLDAFVWNRISQGYSRVVKDDPPHEQWQAWRRGDRDLKVLTYRTPTTSPAAVPVPELSNGTSEMIEEGREEQGCRRDLDHTAAALVVVSSTAAAVVVAPATTTTTTTSALGDVTAPPVRGGEEENVLRYENALSADIAEPLHFRTCLPEWPREMSQVASTSASDTATATTTSLQTRQLSLNFNVNAPEDMKLTVIRCTFSRLEEVDDDFSKHVTLNPSLIKFLDTNF